MLLSIEDAIDKVEEHLEQLREALRILSQPGTLDVIMEVANQWAEDKNSAWLTMRAECAENVIEALWIFIEAHDRIFKESGGMANLCDMIGIDVQSIRDSIRFEMIQPLMEGGLYDVNVFKFREMVTKLVERLHSCGN